MVSHALKIMDYWLRNKFFPTVFNFSKTDPSEKISGDLQKFETLQHQNVALDLLFHAQPQKTA